MRKIAILLIGLMVIGMGFLCGCLEQTSVEQQSNQKEKILDLQFINWLDNVNNIVINDSNNLQNVLNIYDFNSSKTYAEIMYNHMKDFLEEIETYEVSYKMLEIKNEYRNALQNYKWAAFWSKKGSETAVAGDYETANTYFGYATEYTLKGVDSMNRCNALLKQYNDN